MRIGFDLTALSEPPSGIGTYAGNLYSQLRHSDGCDLIGLAHRPIWDPNLGAARRSAVFVNKTMWMQSILPWEVSRARIDLCHFTNNVGALWLSCPSVLTIHDLTMWLYPECHPRKRLMSMRPLIPIAIRRAAAIIAPSETTRRDIVKILGVPESKIHVIYEAPPEVFRPLPPGPELEAVREQYALPDRFILHVGTMEPRKNLVRLLEAYARLGEDVRASCGLVFVGQQGWGARPIFAAAERLALGDSVRFLGYIPLPALVAMYNLAEVVAVPSLYEGFGLPLVEAMASGTPVVASSCGAFTEVAGWAAEMIEPTSIDSIVAGLHRVLHDEQRRHELRARGLARAAQLSWPAAAALTVDLYARVLRGATAAEPSPEPALVSWPANGAAYPNGLIGANGHSNGHSGANGRSNGHGDTAWLGRLESAVDDSALARDS